MARLILLDRDGVINEDSTDYIRRVADWHPLPGSLEAVARLKRAGHLVAVCTNQSGVGRGLMSAADLEAIHRILVAQLAERGAVLDGLRHCPHAPEAGCDCRKPRPGMLLETMENLGVSAQQSLFVGDSLRDQEAAIAAGCRFALVRTGNGAASEPRSRALGAHWVGDDLAAFADWLLGGGN